MFLGFASVMGTDILMKSWHKRAEIPSFRSLWWMKKGWSTVNVFSTGWQQEGHPTTKLHWLKLRISLHSSTLPAICFYCLRRTWWDGVKEDVVVCPERLHRCGTNGDGESRRKLANTGSPGRMAVNSQGGTWLTQVHMEEWQLTVKGETG